MCAFLKERTHVCWMQSQTNHLGMDNRWVGVAWGKMTELWKTVMDKVLDEQPAVVQSVRHVFFVRSLGGPAAGRTLDGSHPAALQLHRLSLEGVLLA